jgi:hypothetical protein
LVLVAEEQVVTAEEVAGPVEAVAALVGKITSL